MHSQRFSAIFIAFLAFLGFVGLVHSQVVRADEDPFAEVTSAFTDFKSAVSATTDLAADFKNELFELQDRSLAIRRFLIVGVDAIILGDALDVAIVEMDNILVRKMAAFATLSTQQHDRAAEFTAKLRDLFLEERVSADDVLKHTAALNMIQAQLDAFSSFTTQLASPLKELRKALAAARELVDANRYHGALLFLVSFTTRIRGLTPKALILLERIATMTDRIADIEKFLNEEKTAAANAQSLGLISQPLTATVTVYDLQGRIVASGTEYPASNSLTVTTGRRLALANGVYLIVVTIKDQNGAVIKQEIKKTIKLH